MAVNEREAEPEQDLGQRDHRMRPEHRRVGDHAREHAAGPGKQIRGDLEDRDRPPPQSATIATNVSGGSRFQPTRIAARTLFDRLPRVARTGTRTASGDSQSLALRSPAADAGDGFEDMQSSKIPGSSLPNEIGLAPDIRDSSAMHASRGPAQ